jgi:hypothetical protein
MAVNCGENSTYNNCNYSLVLTTLKMATNVAETCRDLM